MNTENKTIPTNEPSGPIVNPLGQMDKKTHQQYKLEAHRILVRSSISAVIIWFFLAMLAYILFGVFVIFSFTIFFCQKIAKRETRLSNL